MKVFEFIQKNEKKVQDLTKLGLVNSSIISQYKIYKDFDSLKTSIPLMQRYSLIAERNGVSERTVMTAVKVMKKVI